MMKSYVVIYSEYRLFCPTIFSTLPRSTNVNLSELYTKVVNS